MNKIPIEWYGFSALCLATVIAGIIFNVRSGWASGPLTRRIRQLQNKAENAGWRIQMIPYDDTSRPMTISLNSVWSIVPLVGAFGFLIGIGLAFAKEGPWGIALAFSSWVAAWGGIWLKNRTEQLDWDVAPARCVDRELKKVLLSRGGWGWMWRVVCEYEYLCIPYRATPEVYWANFTSEEAALKFLQERISPNGECMLRVDPKNPLRTELLKLGTMD